MRSLELILQYVTACANGRMPLSECSVVWQLVTIAGLIVLGLIVLAFAIAYRKRAAAPVR
jgi:hypothetical protein